MMKCICGNNIFVKLGKLGNVNWYRCRDCGLDKWSKRN